MKFEEINDSSKIIAYLKEKNRLNNVEYLNQCTSVDSLIKILENGYWYLGNPINMNDLFEYQKYKKISDWDSIFYSSFMANNNESIAMWSMYGQPWNNGIMISIPLDAFFKWKEGIKTIYAADSSTKEMLSKTNFDATADTLCVVRVAYFDNMSLRYKEGKNNTNFANAYSVSEFAGYVKDSAWDYEKEVRLRVDVPKGISCSGIAIKIPDDIIEQIVITKGPRYNGPDLLTSIPKRFRGKIEIRNSVFQDKIAWIPCDTCDEKRKKKENDKDKS